MSRLQFIPEDPCEIFYATVASFRWVFEIGAAKVLRRLPVLKLMNLLVDFLYASMECRTAKKSLYQFTL